MDPRPKEFTSWNQGKCRQTEPGLSQQNFQESWNMMLCDRWPCRAKSISNPPYWLGDYMSGPWQYMPCIQPYNVCFGAPATHPHILITHHSKPKKCYGKWELSPRSKHLGLKNASQKHLQATVFSKNKKNPPTPKKLPSPQIHRFTEYEKSQGRHAELIIPTSNYKCKQPHPRHCLFWISLKESSKLWEQQEAFK